MRIANAQVQMASAHQATVRHEVRQRLTLTAQAGGTDGPAVAPAPQLPPAAPEATDAVSLSPASTGRDAGLRSLRAALRPVADLSASRGARPASLAPGALRSAAAPSAPAATAGGSAARTSGSDEASDDTTSASEGGDLKAAIVRQLFERMTGKKMNIGDLEKALARIHKGGAEAAAHLTTPGAEAAGLAGDIEMPGPVAGLRFEQIETTQESEVTTFVARGVVTTADGQEVEFGVDMALSRKFMEENRIVLEAGVTGQAGGAQGAGGGKAKDPLVINFDAPAAALRDDTVAFDLDADGAKDSVHFLAEGSGFVALDKNGNGQVDDGSELFGARTGDGFAELAAHDDDGNGWIDENDAVFDQLKVWSKDANGQDTLASLKERNVGAIFLGRVAAPHTYKNADNENTAQMRTAGFYLGEIGHRAGSMQQLDLVV